MLHKANKAFERSAPSEALAFLIKAMKMAPDHPIVLLRTGIAFHLMKRFDDAENYYIRAIKNTPTLGDAHNNLGKLYLEHGRDSAAIAAFKNASALLPNSPRPLVAMATAYQHLKLMGEAEKICRSVIHKFPDFAEAHHNLANICLAQGNYLEGWREYEWRWETNRPPFKKRSFQKPAWVGQPIKGKRLLVYTEQGLGDAIQFFRFLPRVASESKSQLTVDCQPPLHPILTSINSEIGLDASSNYDYHVSLLSLPGVLGTTLKTIPLSQGYLHAPREYSHLWSNLVGNNNKLKVGVCWRGNQYPDPRRSCPDDIIQSLLECKNIDFYSLQLAKTTLKDTSKLIDFTSQIRNFADTAALIEQLDLVISIDTSVAHLSGAIGKPTWVMIPFSADWRWGIDGNVSAWYTSVRLFRQRLPADWQGLINEVKESLAKYY